ncbi:MAG: (deoxy)nucleoside triphosphate pyrophosphohydrolase [Lacrimispora celerecrescens]|nr:(deoxy)nucleoside triphosphate pyrophosphohydrolase [Lacrimispora celerecrescens]
MKTIQVSAAIIMKENKILATQRGYGEFNNGWEFPGGKIEKGETAEQALIREINEELDVLIEINTKLKVVEYDYPEFHLTMHCFKCVIKSGTLILKEHKSARWLRKEELDKVEWLPADREIIEELISD